MKKGDLVRIKRADALTSFSALASAVGVVVRVWNNVDRDAIAGCLWVDVLWPEGDAGRLSTMARHHVEVISPSIQATPCGAPIATRNSAENFPL